MTNLSLAIDMMVSCCVGVFVLRDGDLQEVTGEDGLPLGLDARLARVIAPDLLSDDLPEPTPKVVVSALFGGEAMLLGAHASKLVGWMTERSTEGPPLGESSAAAS